MNAESANILHVTPVALLCRPLQAVQPTGLRAISRGTFEEMARQAGPWQTAIQWFLKRCPDAAQVTRNDWLEMFAPDSGEPSALWERENLPPALRNENAKHFHSEHGRGCCETAYSARRDFST